MASLHVTRTVWNTARSLPGQVMGLPPVDHSHLNSDALKDLVARRDPIILEIGCNDGQNTEGFLSLFPESRLYCFEPDPRAAARFRERIGERPNVSLFETAVSDRNGAVTFYQSGGKQDNEWLKKTMPQGWDLSGSIKPPHHHLKKHPLVTFDRQIEVPAITLDAFCEAEAIDSVDFIWMDVQGAELDVFRGAPRTLARTRFLYTEYSDRELYRGQVGLRQMLKQLPGFKVITRYPDDALLKNEHFAV